MKTLVNNDGFTIIEVIVCMACIGIFALVGFGVGSLIHFIIKFW